MTWEQYIVEHFASAAVSGWLQSVSLCSITLVSSRLSLTRHRGGGRIEQIPTIRARSVALVGPRRCQTLARELRSYIALPHLSPHTQWTVLAILRVDRVVMRHTGFHELPWHRSSSRLALLRTILSTSIHIPRLGCPAMSDSVRPST